MERAIDARAAAEAGHATWLLEVDLTWGVIDAAARSEWPRWCHPAVVALRDSIDAWATRFHLREGWLLDQAVQTLALWALLPRLARPDETEVLGEPGPRRHPRDWFGVSLMRRDAPGEEEREVGPFTWDPQAERRAHAERRIIAEVRAELDRIEDAARALGLVPAPERRERKGDHFRWLVLYQVEQWTVAEIAAEDGVAPKSVDEALVGVAEQVGIVLRKPNPRGSPRKIRRG